MALEHGGRVSKPPKMEIVPLAGVVPQQQNANAHTQRGMGALEQSIRADGLIDAMTVAANNETFSGSARREKLEELGFTDAIVVESDGTKPVIIRRTDIPTAQDPRAVRLGLAANRVAQLNLAWAPEVLATLPPEALTGLWTQDEQLTALAPETLADGQPDPYTHKILSPHYEPSGDAPPIADLFDASRAAALLAEIAAAPALPNEVRIFLEAAAQRHTVFNFKRIADYYASAPAAIQTLMEASALVIIDYDDAIRRGYVQLADKIAQLRHEDYSDEDA